MIEVMPDYETMFYTPLQMKAKGLPQGKPVTISAYVDYPLAGRFRSCAHYIADATGCVDLTTAHSTGGSFQGIHPMGLFWSLHQTPGQRPGCRLLPRKVDKPVKYTISVHHGHLNFDSPEEQLETSKLLSTDLMRHFIHPDVERTEVTCGRIRGAFFRPKNAPAGSLPGIVDLFGTAGGLVQHRSALLAAKGFAVLCLTYFNYADLPPLDQLELEYFEEAVEWLDQQPCVRSGGVGVVGVSLGASLATLMGVHLPLVTASVSINGDHCFEAWVPLKFRGQQFVYAEPADFDLLDRLREEHFSDGKLRMAVLRSAMDIKFEHQFQMELAPKDHKFLFLACADDKSATAVQSAKANQARLRLFDPDNCDRRLTIVEFEGAGHLLEPPFVPMVYESWHSTVGKVLVWGGNIYDHAAAQDKGWDILQQFFTDNIGQPMHLKDFYVKPTSKL